MKTISEYINNVSTLNEAKEMEYVVSFVGAKHKDMPFSVRIMVPKEVQSDFEKFLEDEQDNIFIHAEGGDVEY